MRCICYGTIFTNLFQREKLAPSGFKTLIWQVVEQFFSFGMMAAERFYTSIIEVLEGVCSCFLTVQAWLCEVSASKV